MSKEESHIDEQLPANLAVILAECRNKQEFVVPEGYFDQLSAELRLGILRNQRDSEFSAPDDYFEDTANKIIASVTHHQEDEMFFDSQRDQIMSEIRLRELVANNHEFDVPEGYFESAAEKTKQHLFGAKVFVLRKWMGYAAAASVILAAVFFFLPDKQNLQHESFAELINKNPVDAEDIEYFSDEEDAFDLYISLMEEDTIIVDSLKTVPDDQFSHQNDSLIPAQKLDPKTGLPLKSGQKSNAVSWDELSDEELMEYLFEEGDEEILNDME